MKNSKGESTEGGDREGKGKWTADEKVGGKGWKRRGAKRERERSKGEKNERRNREEEKDREKRDGQSMKQFDY